MESEDNVWRCDFCFRLTPDDQQVCRNCGRDIQWVDPSRRPVPDIEEEDRARRKRVLLATLDAEKRQRDQPTPVRA